MALTGDDYRNAGNVRTRRFKESKASTGYKQVGIFMSAESRELLHILKHQHGWTTQEAVEHIFKTYKNAMNDVAKEVVINDVNNVYNNIIIPESDFTTYKNDMNDVVKEVVINNIIDDINNVDNNINVTALDTIPDTQNLNDAELEHEEVLVYREKMEEGEYVLPYREKIEEGEYVLVYPEKIVKEYEQPIHQLVYPEKIVEEYEQPIHQKAKFYNDKLLEDYKLSMDNRIDPFSDIKSDPLFEFLECNQSIKSRI